MFNSFFQNSTTQFASSEIEINEKKAVITRLNWDYKSALEFQLEANQFIYDNPEFEIYIVTSHPTVLTMGRGLQRGMVQKHDLKEFDQTLSNKLPVEVLEIKRGGGLTFHHPGQIVIYPIVHITSQKMKTLQLINALFELTKTSIESISGIRDLDYSRDLLGLWHEHSKVASMGIQLIKFVSLHGLALNVLPDNKINEIMGMVFPCGLQGTTYKTLSDITSINYDELIEVIKKNLIEKKITSYLPAY